MAEDAIMCPECEVRELVDGKCPVCGYGAKAEAKSPEKEGKKKA